MRLQFRSVRVDTERSRATCSGFRNGVAVSIAESYETGAPATAGHDTGGAVRPLRTGMREPVSRFIYRPRDPLVNISIAWSRDSTT